METLISVVVPVYNVERYLDRCISSIVGQSYYNLEILLVDDGSTDSCPAICDAWAGRDSRVCVIHKKNEGLGMARNTGIEAATGAYICFFDSDDYVDQSIIEKAYRLAEMENSDLTVFGLTKVDESGTVLRSFVPDSPKTVFRDREVREQFLPDLINSSCEDAVVRNVSLSACVCLFRMELIQRAAWRFVSEREIISEDSYSLLKLYEHVNSVAILPENGYFYCRNQASLTQVYREERYAKTRQFYVKSLELAEQLDYSSKVKDRLGRLFLAFVVGAMKQIAVSKLSYWARYQLVKTIITDEPVQTLLHRLPIKCYGPKIRVLFFAMRWKLCLPAYVLVCLQAVYGRQDAAG